MKVKEVASQGSGGRDKKPREGCEGRRYFNLCKPLLLASVVYAAFYLLPTPG